MTIAAAYMTSEGVVLGADSATIVSVQPPGGPLGVVQLVRHSQKVFEVGEGSRFGLCTWGSGSCGSVSHRTVVARLAGRLSDDATVESAKDSLTEVVQEALAAGPSHQGMLGYYLGGWNPGCHEAECYHVVFPVAGEPEVKPLGLGEASFSGAPKFFARVFRGYDPELRTRLLEGLRSRLSVDGSELDRMFGEAFKEASAPLVAAGLRDLPIREAIDYVHTYLHVTVKAFKFQFGVPVCGGPIEVAFISTDRRFRWVRHKGFDSAIREEEGRSWTARPSL